MTTISDWIKSQNITFDETLNIENLLNNISIDDYEYIDINIEDCVHNSLTTLHLIPSENLSEIKEKLKKYRLIDDIYLLHKGKHVRWINKEVKGNKSCLLQSGGVVVDIKFVTKGTNIVILNKYNKKCIQIQFDKILLFQKLSIEEEMILYLKRTI